MNAVESIEDRVQIPLPAQDLNSDRIAYLEPVVSRARIAAAVFTQLTREDVDRIIKPLVLAGLEQAQHLPRLAVAKTRLGVMEDKVIKSMVASEFVYNHLKDKRTVGVIRKFPERNLIEGTLLQASFAELRDPAGLRLPRKKKVSGKRRTVSAAAETASSLLPAASVPSYGLPEETNRNVHPDKLPKQEPSFAQLVV
jgi:hypothetical protein